MDSLVLRLLGAVEAWTGATWTEPGSPRHRLMLAALASDAGRPVAVELLVDRIWGDRAPAGARSTLRTYLARVRRDLEQIDAGGEVTITRASGGYVLHIESDRVDVHRFRRLVDQARQATGLDRLDMLRQAVGLWRGRPLAGLPGEWAERTRQAWRWHQVDAVLEWTAAELADGLPTATLEPLSVLAHDHPLTEPLIAMQIRALAATGRVGEALDHYDTARRRLAEELGIDPGTHLRSAHLAVLRGGV